MHITACAYYKLFIGDRQMPTTVLHAIIGQDCSCCNETYVRHNSGFRRLRPGLIGGMKIKALQ